MSIIEKFNSPRQEMRESIWSRTFFGVYDLLPVNPRYIRTTLYEENLILITSHLGRFSCSDVAVENLIMRLLLSNGMR